MLRAMQLSPRRHSTIADLLRVIAGWMVVVIVLQGLAAMYALGSGPLHRHARSDSNAVHQHGKAERHHHAVGDAATAVVAVADETADLVAFALTAAMTLLAVALAATRRGDERNHVLRHAPPWSLNTACLALLRRPPRAC